MTRFQFKHVSTNDQGPMTADYRFRYNPIFLMYSATAGSTNFVSGFLAATASRIAVAETFWCTFSSRCTVAPDRTRSPFAGCLANGLVTADFGRSPSGSALATSAREYPGRLA